MKLVRNTPIEVEGYENNFTSSEEITSDNLDELKSRVDELCRLMEVKPTAWASRYSIMGNNQVKSNAEWVMILDNGTIFSIKR